MSTFYLSLAENIVIENIEIDGITIYWTKVISPLVGGNTYYTINNLYSDNTILSHVEKMIEYLERHYNTYIEYIFSKKVVKMLPLSSTIGYLE